MGLSTPITAATLVRLAGPSASAQAAYLRHFRADNCVRDLEAVRKCLTEESANEDSKKWSVMGQSYGGFVAVSYLSKFPEGLKEVFTMGGLPPVTQKGPDEVYRRLYRKVIQRNQVYYRKFPEDGDRVKRILEYLATKNGLLPTSGVLTPGRFMDMGIRFGSHGGLDAVHDIVLQAANDLEIFGFLTRPTLTRIEIQGAFDDYCLYAVLHEPIYSQGDVQSDWSADRVIKEFPRFDHQTHEAEILFTGEMIFKRTFADYPELNRLEPAAEILSKVKDWSELYDVEQLKRNQVPVYSSTYVDDMYVDFGFARETAALIRGCKTFVTNALYHDAPSKKPEELMRALFFLKEDSID
jgi:pimeloyl-ACP methyl ester carboxylesterase